MFSSRIPRDLALNRLASSISAHRASGRPLIDLTVTNPTAVGIHYDADLLASLSSAAALTYSPEPFGIRAARHAVVDDYAARGISVAEDRIVLTASTSEAYSVLFKLLCAPEGDDVLVPHPSYPLFDHLTRLDGVSCHPYFLEYHGRWVVDERSVENAWTARTRAILAVTPNNPTGSSLSPAELSGLSRRCADLQAALILDEVFADYMFDEAKEREIIRQTLNVYAEICGKPAKGWLSSSLRSTLNTIDIIAEEGLIFITDLLNDDQPYLVETRSGKPMVSIPYTSEVNDFTVFMRQGLTVDDAFKVFKEQFDWLYRESETSGRFMNIGLHPHVIGQPFRIRALRDFVAYAKQFGDVWFATREEIAEWYLQNHKSHIG